METAFIHQQDLNSLPVVQLDEQDYVSALAQAQRLLDAEPVAPIDAVIHGVRVRLHTTNPHWRRFWSANWFAPDQWETLVGQPSPDEPQVHLYALPLMAQETPQAGYNRAHNAAFLWGDMPYGPLRALTLDAVAYLLAEEEAVHFVPGIFLQEGAEGMLLLRSPALDPAVVVPTLLARERAHLVALDGVFVRYGLVRMVDGVTLLPTLVIDEKGDQIPGYRLFPWLDEYGYWEPRADARCLTLEGGEEYCFARDLDLGRDPEAFAYPMERAWYLPTQIVAAKPGLVGVLWSGLLENVPPLTQELLDRFGAWAREAVSSLVVDADSPTRLLLDELGQEGLIGALCRLRADPQARALVPPEWLWPGRAGGHPWQPLRIGQVALMGDEGLIPLAPQALPEFLVGDKDEIASALTRMLARAAQNLPDQPSL